MYIEFLIIGALIFLPLVGMVLVFLFKKNIDHRRSLQKVHLQILIPRKDAEADAKQDTAKDFKDYIGLMEQLLVAMNALYSGKLWKRLE